MNRQDILNEITELKKKLNSLEKLYASLTPPNKKWRSNKGGVYYYISDGYSEPVEADREDNSVVDDLRYATGNYFETREEAEFEVKRLKVITELKDWATPANDLNWDDDNVRKYCILLEWGEVVVDYCTKYQFSDLGFASEEAAKNAIEAVGEDRIIKYYFRKGEKNADSD